ENGGSRSIQSSCCSRRHRITKLLRKGLHEQSAATKLLPPFLFARSQTPPQAVATITNLRPSCNPRPNELRVPLPVCRAGLSKQLRPVLQLAFPHDHLDESLAADENRKLLHHGCRTSRGAATQIRRL